MTASRQHRFVWIDLETTGLDPSAPGAAILEWALVLAADDDPDDLAPVECFSSPVRRKDTATLRGQASLAVREMHDRNGLWLACASPEAASLADGEAAMLEVVERLTVSPTSRVTIAGSSVHFDHAWLRVHMPRLAARLSHRVFDVSTLTAAAEYVGGLSRDAMPPPAHRALDDVLGSLALAKASLRALRGSP